MHEDSGSSVEQASAQSRNPCIRLWLLRILEAMPGYTGNNELMHTALAYVGLPLSQVELLTQLKFLAERELVTLDHRVDFNVWVVTLTRSGQDVARGITKADGIERPQAQASARPR